MEFMQYINIIILGFFVWFFMAPKISSPRYGELLTAYMAALMFSLVATSEIIMVKPVAFFFTVGGAFAFVYLVASLTIRVNYKK